MDNIENHNTLTRQRIILWIIAMAASFAGCVITRQGWKESIQLFILVIVLNFLLSFYMQMKEEKISGGPYASWLIGVAYGCSVAMLLFITEDAILPAGLLGCVLLSGLYDLNLGLFPLYGLGFIHLFCQISDLKWIGALLILGTILCIAVSGTKTLHAMLYTILITLTMNITIQFLLNEFSASRVFVKKTWIESACLSVVILLSYLIFHLFAVMNEKSAQEEIAITKPANEFWEDLSNSSEKEYKDVVDESAVLLMQMKQMSDNLYQHSKKIGEISKKAAQYIGANADLACAGGWYHEIGRLKGNDYIANGVQMIAEYHLPQPIADIIRQQNYQNELPQSKEAAIVMLTDTIVGTFLYLKTNQAVKITSEKVIENTFSVRLEKGSLNESGLSITDYNKLKEFYLGIIPQLS